MRAFFAIKDVEMRRFFPALIHIERLHPRKELDGEVPQQAHTVWIDINATYGPCALSESRRA